jgi:hypothetical protein
MQSELSTIRCSGVSVLAFYSHALRGGFLKPSLLVTEFRRSGFGLGPCGGLNCVPSISLFFNGRLDGTKGRSSSDSVYYSLSTFHQSLVVPPHGRFMFGALNDRRRWEGGGPYPLTLLLTGSIFRLRPLSDWTCHLSVNVVLNLLHWWHTWWH